MPIMTYAMGGGGIRIPLEPVTNLIIESRDSSANIRWKDPVDKYTTPGDNLAAKWAYTIVVRKENSPPSSPRDGVIATKETIRNQHETDPFSDKGLENGVTYYYAVYSCTSSGTFSEGNFMSVVPSKGYPAYYGLLSYVTINASHRNGVSIKDHALIGYGTVYGGSYTSVTSGVSAIDNSLSVKSVDGGTAAENRSAVALDTMAFFGGGYWNGSKANVDVIDETLSRKRAPSLYSGVYSAGASRTKKYAIFAGGNMGVTSLPYRDESYAYDSSLTVNTSLDRLSVARSDLVGGRVGQYAMFIGGRNSALQSAVDAYSETLSKLSLGNLPYSGICQSGSLDQYAIVTCDQVPNVISFDSSLTRRSLDNFPTTEAHVLCSFGNYVMATSGSNKIYLFDSSLTRTELADVTDRVRGNSDPCATDKYALFPLYNYTDSTHSNWPLEVYEAK